MEIHFTIKQTEEKNAPEKLGFSADHIQIGRNPQNDIYLNNPFISRFHAEITLNDSGTYQLACFNNKWAKINDHLLEGNAPSRLSDGDTIFLPCYEIEVSIIDEKTTDELPPHETGTIALDLPPRNRTEINGKAKQLAFRLRKTYAEFFRGDRETRKRALKSCVENYFDSETSLEERREIFFFAKNIFQTARSQGSIPPTPPRIELEAARSITAMIKALNKNIPIPEKAQEVGDLGKHWTVIVHLLTKSLFEQIEWLKDLGWSLKDLPASNGTTPFNNLKSPGHLSSYLFDWKKADSENVSRCLRALLDEIKTGQEGLSKKAPHKCLAILDALSPLTLLKEFNEERSSVFQKRFLSTKRQKIWNRFVEKHRELSERIRKEL